MATNTFVLTKDLEQLTEEERRLHLENVCASLGLDSKAGLLKYARMDRGDGSGERHLVLYATKGATDKLRDIHGVDVIEMTDKVIGGAIVYTAKGKNKAGRIDIAVGAATIENKHGENLAKAFAIAQTRASRRLTLQFSGSGLIDESEVSDSPAPVATQMSFPDVVQPPAASSAVGVDVTGLTVKEPPTKASAPPAVEEPRLKNPAEGLKPIGVMAAPDGKKPTVKAVASAEEQTVPEAVVEPAEVSTEAPKRRRRRTKAEMEAARAVEAAEEHSDAPVGVIEDPEQPQVAATAAEEPKVPLSTPVAEPQAGATAPAPASEKPKAKVTVPLLGDKPNQEQMTLYVNRLMKYSDDILPSGGMIPSQGMGPRKKVREFMKIVNAGADLNQLTVPQWENSFRYLDQMLEQKGAVELAKVIEYNLETANEPETVTA